MPRVPRVLVLSIALGGFLVAAPAQGVKPKPKPNPEVKAKLETFIKRISDQKAPRDAEAIEIVDELAELYPNMHSSDQARFVKDIARALSSTGIRRSTDDADLYKSIIVALGISGPRGSSSLIKSFETKKFKGKLTWVPLRALMLEHLGRAKDPKRIDFLVNEARNNMHNELMAAAGGALRHYADQKLKVRKEICKVLIKKFASVFDNGQETSLRTRRDQTLAEQQYEWEIWRQRFKTIDARWTTTLQALTKQDLEGTEAWTRFWNKDKGKNWDKDE